MGSDIQFFFLFFFLLDTVPERHFYFLYSPMVEKVLFLEKQISIDLHILKSFERVNHTFIYMCVRDICIKFGTQNIMSAKYEY